MDFMTQVARLDKPMTTREQMYGYFQKEFPGTPKEPMRWKSEFARQLQPHTKSAKTGAPLSYSNVRRRFEGEREHKPVSEQHAKEYKELGKHLPPIRPERGYHIKGTVCISVGDYPCEERKWDHKVVGVDADYLHKTGSLQAMVNIYFGDLPEEEDNRQAELCDDEEDCKSKLKVTALSVKGARHLPNLNGSR